MKLHKLIQIGFWTTALIIWLTWINERVQVFEYFVNNYKNIGFLVSTNDNQWEWYMLSSLFKIVFIFFITYRLIPKYNFQLKTALYSFYSIIISCFLESLSSYLYYSFLITNQSENLIIEWDYNVISIFLIYVLLGLLSWILSAAYYWFNEYQNLKKLHKDQQSYIKLKEQLNPHFLFNSLNNLYEMAIKEDNEKMSEGILNLTETLRYTLDFSTKNKVLLIDEIKAIRSFVNLQNNRFEEDEIIINNHLKEVNTALKITPLILLNYIENAFLHGFKYEENSEINIHLSENLGKIHLSIKNTDHAVRNNPNGGNEKVRKILRLNYPGKHEIKEQKMNNYYILDLWIQLN